MGGQVGVRLEELHDGIRATLIISVLSKHCFAQYILDSRSLAHRFSEIIQVDVVKGEEISAIEPAQCCHYTCIVLSSSE
jgi:hypothetical protein